MKFQSRLLVACIFLFSVVSAASYEAFVNFNKIPWSKNPSAYRGYLNIKNFDKPVVLTVTGDIGFKEHLSEGTVEISNLKALKSSYQVTLSDNRKSLKIDFKSGKSSEFHFKGSSIAKKAVKNLKGSAQVKH
ncbi:hypothetical protein DFQ28_005718 [Apophysomyces sp. BC1034]|nr:hypothetical protein DFQ30_003775 [Apophysomyces sp. BC1015]KAG0182629.1 hypothetical protein DFQ29_003182 [Apophysomyces sp. BC1021]KAG0193275.1 hypothetical protein DFQ28_005718 [Apophysomyces sp. BC1034]